MDRNRFHRTTHRNTFALGNGHGSHEGGHLAAYRLDVCAVVFPDRQGIRLRDINQLIDNACHPIDVEDQGALCFAISESFRLRPEDREWRAQLVCGVGEKFTLDNEPTFQSVKSLVDRPDKRGDFARHPRFRQAEVGMCWVDPLHEGRSLDQWSQRSAEDHQVDANQDQQNGNDHASYVRQKFRNDVVDEHVAMRLVLRDLQPEHLTSDIDRHTGTEYAGLPDIAFEVSRLATPWIALEQWLIVFAT